MAELELIAALKKAKRTIKLLNLYGTAKFGDEWWPGNAAYLDDEQAEELAKLLDDEFMREHYPEEDEDDPQGL